MIPVHIPPNETLRGAELLGTVLLLHWADGHEGELPLETARAHCPCAACGGERMPRQTPPLRMASATSRDEVVAIRTVGRYALQFEWRDGHSDGIYSFELLRSLCRCPECDPGRE
ncbi:MAG: DUF971 domain-containing protein [Acidobacteriota bacterium]